MKDNNQIWVAFKSGDEDAFSELYFTYYSQLYQYGLKLVQEEELVKDTLQDFYLYLFESRQELADEVKNITSYLLVAFRRRLMRAIKLQRIEKQHDQEERADRNLFVISAEEIVIERESQAQYKEQVVRLLNALPPRQREILYLKYYLNLTLPEIAETIGVSYQVVANHLYRAHNKLKERVLS